MKGESTINYIGKCLLINSGKEKILVIGDLHLGFEESLNQSGVLVTRVMMDETMKELEKVFDYIANGTGIISYNGGNGASELLKRGDEIGNVGGDKTKNKKRGETGKELVRGESVSAEAEGNGNKKKKTDGGVVDKIILLGDVKHFFGRILRQEWDDVLKLLEYLKGKCKSADGVVIIKGNHDIMLKPIAAKLGLKVRDFFVWKKEFCFLHGNKDFEKAHDKEVKYWIIGHGHPAVALKSGPRTERYKCFLTGKFAGKSVVMLPSFSEWYVGSDPREGRVVVPWKMNFDNFNVKIVSEDLKVLDFGLLRKLK